MRNKLVNKKVVNAIGIGILAFVTATSPTLTALAVDGDGAGEPGGNTENSGPVDTAPVEAPGQNAEVSGSIDAAQGAISDTQKEINTAQEEVTSKENELLGTEKESVNDPAVSEKLSEADRALGDLNDDIKGKDGLDDLNRDAAEKKETWGEKLDSATNDEKDGWLDKTSSDATDASDAVKELGNATTDALADTTEGKAAEAEAAQKVTYENAGAAQNAKDQANTMAAEAEAIRDQAQAAYDEAEKKLDAAKTSCDVADKLWVQAEKAYTDAKTAVEKARDELKNILEANGIDEGDLGKDTLDANDFDGNVRTALENAQAALKQAEEDYAKAGRELAEAGAAQETASTNLKNAQEGIAKVKDDLDKLGIAEGDLASAVENEEKWKGTSDTLDTAKGNLEKAETDRDLAAENAEAAAKALKDAQQELLAGEARDQQKLSIDAGNKYEDAKNAVDKALAGKKKQEAWEEEKKAREDFVSSMNELAETQIKYHLQNQGIVDDLDDITFSEWVSSREENNYVLVTYKDKDGETHYEYYDYSEVNGGITVVRKADPTGGEYVNGNKTSLTVKNDENGNQEFWMGSNRLSDSFKVMDGGSPEIGYTVIIPEGSGKREVNTYHPYAPRATVSIEVTRVTLDEVTTYFVDGKEAKVEFHSDGKTIDKINGTTVMIEAGQNTGWKKTNNKPAVEIFFGPTFSGKGEDCGISMPTTDKTVDELKETATNAKTNKVEKDGILSTAEGDVSAKKEVLDTELGKAKEQLTDADVEITDDMDNDAVIGAVAEQLRQAEVTRSDAEGKVAEIEKPYKEKAEAEQKAVKDYLAALKEAWPEKERELQEALKTAEDTVTVKGAIQTAANVVLESVKSANSKIMAAVKRLSDLSAQEGVSEAEYEAAKKAYNNAVDAYLKAAAAKGASEANLQRIIDAAARARAAADAQFAYNTPTTPDDGYTGAGDGGTPAPGATETPAVAPAVTPVAATAPTGPAAAAVEEEAGGETVDIGESDVPLAAGQQNGSKEDETVDMEDVQVPLAMAQMKVAEGRMSWWWLLVVAALGVTGEEMYRRHRKKLAETNDRTRG